MHTLRSLLMILFLLNLSGCGHQSPPVEKTKATSLANVIAIESEDWWALRNEMGNHFRESIERIVEQKPEEAATEIEKGAVFARAEAGRGKSRYQEPLSHISEKLDGVAGEIRSGSEVSLERLGKLFGQTEFLLSQHHVERARTAYEENNAIALGRAMIRAVDGLESAYQWTGHKVTESTRSVFQQTKSTANNFMTNAKMVKDSVSHPLKPVNKEFEDFGSKIQYKDPKREYTDMHQEAGTSTADE